MFYEAKLSTTIIKKIPSVNTLSDNRFSVLLSKK